MQDGDSLSLPTGDAQADNAIGQRAGPSPHDSLFVAPQPNLHGSPSPQGLDVASLTHEQLLGNSLYLSLVTEQVLSLLFSHLFLCSFLSCLGCQPRQT